MAHPEIALLLLPAALIGTAGTRSRAATISHTRSRLFDTGLFTATMTEIFAGLCVLSPFPLRADGQGGYSNIWNDVCLIAALVGSLLTLLLALLGVGLPRALLLIAAILLAMATYAAMLSNFV